MVNAENRTISLGEKEISFNLERKDVKNLNLRIRKNGTVFVSANFSVSLDEIENFVRRKERFILDSINKVEEATKYRIKPKQFVSGETFMIQGRSLRLEVSQGSKEEISTDGIYLRLVVRDTNDFEKKRRMVNRYMDNQCEAVFEEILAYLYPVFKKYGVEYPVLHIRNMETRWGSCLAKKGILTLNKRLLEAPRNCIEYVVMHELCHFIHPNHSSKFYEFLTIQMPDWKERKKYLDQTAINWC